MYAVATVLETTMNTPVYYAFPLVRDYAELEQRILGIINYTILIRVRDMPIKTILDCEPHTIEVDLPAGNLNNISITIYSSKPEKLPRSKYTILSKALTELVSRENLPKAKQVVHLDPEKLQQILEKELKKKAKQEELGPELIEKQRY